MKNNTEAVTSAPNELLNDLHSIVNEAENMTGDSLSEHTTAAVSALRKRFDAAHERLAGIYTDARTKVVAGAKCTDATIRANPYQSLAIAAGVGLLVGVLVGRRSK